MQVMRPMTEFAITLHSAATALAAPSGSSAGGAPSAACDARFPASGPVKWLLTVDGSTTISMTGAILCRHDGSVWRKAETLASTIALTSTLGYEVVLEGLVPGERYAVQATLDTGNVTIALTPIGVQG